MKKDELCAESSITVDGVRFSLSISAPEEFLHHHLLDEGSSAETAKLAEKFQKSSLETAGLLIQVQELFFQSLLVSSVGLIRERVTKNLAGLNKQ